MKHISYTVFSKEANAHTPTPPQRDAAPANVEILCDGVDYHDPASDGAFRRAEVRLSLQNNGRDVIGIVLMDITAASGGSPCFYNGEAVARRMVTNIQPGQATRFTVSFTGNEAESIYPCTFRHNVTITDWKLKCN